MNNQSGFPAEIPEVDELVQIVDAQDPKLILEARVVQREIIDDHQCEFYVGSARITFGLNSKIYRRYEHGHSKGDKVTLIKLKSADKSL